MAKKVIHSEQLIMRVNPIATASMEDKSICACSSKQGRWQFRRYMPTIMDIDDDK